MKRTLSTHMLVRADISPLLIVALYTHIPLHKYSHGSVFYIARTALVVVVFVVVVAVVVFVIVSLHRCMLLYLSQLILGAVFGLHASILYDKC